MLRTFIRRFIRKKEGTTSLEFSLLFIPYLTLSLGVIELALMFTAGSLLEGATGSASRLIRTGQIQQAVNADPEEMFRDRLCSHATVLIDCDAIEVEVVPMTSYADFDNYAPTFDQDGNLVSQGFDAGLSNDRMLIRTSYSYSMLTPLVGPLLSGEDGNTVFVSTIVLQTEPYEF